MRRFNKIFILLLACLLTMSIVGCKKPPEIEIASNEYLAGGTIPASAKITPLYRDDVPMVMHYTSEAAKQYVLSSDEIKEITEKTDRYCLLVANPGAEDYDRTELDFLSGFDNQFVWDNQEGKQKTILNSNQIFIISMQDNGEAHVAVITDSTIVELNKEYLECGLLRFIKEDGIWKVAGSKSLGNIDPTKYRYGLDKENTIIIQEEITPNLNNSPVGESHSIPTLEYPSNSENISVGYSVSNPSFDFTDNFVPMGESHSIRQLSEQYTNPAGCISYSTSVNQGTYYLIPAEPAGESHSIPVY